VSADERDVLRNEMAGFIEAVIVDVLEMDAVPPDADFFGDLGWDSLQLTMVASMIEAALGLEVLEDAFESSTVTGLGDAVVDALRAGRAEPDLVDLDALAGPVRSRLDQVATRAAACGIVMPDGLAAAEMS
jgi:acyl carrier protein